MSNENCRNNIILLMEFNIERALSWYVLFEVYTAKLPFEIQNGRRPSAFFAARY